jgi:polysaccharide export outer membrane protein
MKTEHWIKGVAFLLFLLLITWALPVLGQEEVPSTEGAETSDTEMIEEDYRIGAGDLLSIVVWKNSDLSGEFRVRPDGKFSMPLIGDIVAAGRTTDQINMQIGKKLELFIDSPYVTAIIKETTSNRVYVIGEVARPGAYPIAGSLTVLQAVALAGGFTQFADRDRMVLVRGSGKDQENFKLNYKKILMEPGGKYNMVLQRGDTLVVP